MIFAYGSRADTQEFGLWLNAGGTTMTAWGFGGGNDKVFTMPSAVNDGAWHQVVQTYNGTTLTLYIDGVALAAQAATRGTVMDAYGFGIGAVIAPETRNSGGFFNGSIDEVSFYTTALEPDERHRPLRARHPGGPGAGRHHVRSPTSRTSRTARPPSSRLTSPTPTAPTSPQPPSR